LGDGALLDWPFFQSIYSAGQAALTYLCIAILVGSFVPASARASGNLSREIALGMQNVPEGERVIGVVREESKGVPSGYDLPAKLRDVFRRSAKDVAVFYPPIQIDKFGSGLRIHDVLWRHRSGGCKATMQSIFRRNHSALWGEPYCGSHGIKPGQQLRIADLAIDYKPYPVSESVAAIVPKRPESPCVQIRCGVALPQLVEVLRRDLRSQLASGSAQLQPRNVNQKGCHNGEKCSSGGSNRRIVGDYVFPKTVSDSVPTDGDMGDATLRGLLLFGSLGLLIAYAGLKCS
jgi:hypothetical protein